jgi:predicted transcriptional regulator
MKDRRTKLQIYYDVISAILLDSQAHMEISKTRIQQKCNTSYDKLIKYLDEMHEKGLINNTEKIEVTELGSKFFQDYSKVSNMIEEITQRIS